MKSFMNIFLYILPLYFTLIHARVLKADSLVTCMEKSQITASNFDVEFDPDDSSLRYTLDFTTEISGYIDADVDVYAYGFKIISKTINLCSLNWKQFCPLYPGQVEVDSIEYLDKKYTSLLPGIAFTVPDIDAFARVTVKNTNGTQVACIQASFTNGKTVSQTGAKWATAVIAGLGLLASAIASAFGNSNAASNISANAVLLFLYFQSVVIVSMQHVDLVPPIASAWSINLAWSMGLIRVEFMQKIFRWYVQATGGDPSLYLTSSTINVLVQRSIEYTSDLARRGYDLVKRAKPVVLYGNQTVLIFRGIKRLAYEANIENTSIVVTGFTFFILCAYVLVGLVFVFKYGSEILVRAGVIKATRFIDIRTNWRTVLKGSILRYIYIGFTQLVILSLYEFYVQDSPAVIVLAVLFLLLALGVLLWTAFRVITFAKISIREHKNPAVVLYGNQKILDKYGFFYTMFKADKYWWGVVLIAHTLFKAIFIALGQASGKTQAIAFWIIDMVYLGLVIHYKPFLNTPTNIINISIQLVTTINSFLFTFFSNIFGQPAAVGSIMGWVFFVLNAAFSLILLVMILVLCAFMVFSKNPDSRFRPAKDDRTSFQRFSYNRGLKGPTAELLALGLTAKDHDANWESEIHNLQNLNNSNDLNTSTTNSKDENYDRSTTPEEEKETLADKLVRKLTRGKSTKKTRNFSNKRLLSDDQNLDDDHHLDNANAVGNNSDVIESAINDGGDYDENDAFRIQTGHRGFDDDDNDYQSNDFDSHLNHHKDGSVASFNHTVTKLNSHGITKANDFI